MIGLFLIAYGAAGAWAIGVFLFSVSKDIRAELKILAGGKKSPLEALKAELVLVQAKNSSEITA